MKFLSFRFTVLLPLFFLVNGSTASSAPSGDVSASNQFTVELFKKVKTSEKNIFLSPLSIRVALGMTSVGARGETRNELNKALHFSSEESVFLDDMKAELKSLSENSKPEDSQIQLAQGIWVHNTFSPSSNFLSTIKNIFSGTIETLDFSKEEASRKAINKWVEEKTHDKIRDLIPSGIINDMTRMILANAIYFKGLWFHPFKKENTKDEFFFSTKGSKTKIPMMNQTELFSYAQDAHFQIAKLYYLGSATSLTILLPKKNVDLNKALTNLTAPTLEKLDSQFQSHRLNMFLPHFTATFSFEVSKVLQSLGVRKAFNVHEADFSGISRDTRINISAVLHKAFISVDETGTEAAAATAVATMEGMARPAQPEKPIEFRADHPFVYFITDENTGAILFIGRYDGQPSS